ncbi:uncharacterized protein LOC143288924 [Babylonia areolata]|uniref:uncharacterized protein LOC143288924 n=1 Tax=Babylonia areolata TaxID=304850 RepID=UPI003FD28A14
MTKNTNSSSPVSGDDVKCADFPPKSTVAVAVTESRNCAQVSTAVSSTHPMSAVIEAQSRPVISVASVSPSNTSVVTPCTDTTPVQDHMADLCATVRRSRPPSSGETTPLSRDGDGGKHPSTETPAVEQAVASCSKGKASREKLTAELPEGATVPEATTDREGNRPGPKLHPEAKPEYLAICDMFCGSDLGPCLSPPPFMNCELKAVPSMQDSLPQQPASSGRKKRKQKCLQKKETLLLPDVDSETTSEGSTVSQGGSAAAASRTGRALNQGTKSATNVASLGSDAPQARTSKRQSTVQSLGVKVNASSNQRGGQRSSLSSAVEQAKREMMLRNPAVAQDSRLARSSSSSPSGWDGTAPLSVCEAAQKGRRTAGNTVVDSVSGTEARPMSSSSPTQPPKTRRKRKAGESTTTMASPIKKPASGKRVPSGSLGQKVQGVVGDFYCDGSVPADSVISQLTQMGRLSDCWVPLVLTVIMLLKSDARSLLKEVEKACGRADISPAARKQLQGRVFMDEAEVRFLHLLLRCMEENTGCDRGRLMQTLWAAIFSSGGGERTSVVQRASLCRLFVGLCGSSGSVEEVRALAYQLVVARCDGLVTIVLAMAAVWPRPLTRLRPTDRTGGVVVVEHMVMSAVSSNSDQAKVGVCLEHLCHWDRTTLDALSLIGLHVKALQTAFENGHKVSSPHVYELSRCVEMLCAANDAMWIVKNFLERALRSALQKWSSKGEGGCSPHMVVAVCRLAGKVIRPDLRTKNKVLSQLINSQLRSTLFSQHKHQDVEAACVEMLLSLAPLKPRSVFSLLEEFCKTRSTQLPLHLQDRIKSVRTLVNSRLRHKV